MITIIGAGKLGSHLASKIQRAKLGDITLIDMSDNRAKNKALNNVQVALNSKSNGKITYSNNYQDIQKSELVIIFAGQDSQLGMAQPDFINANAQN